MPKTTSSSHHFVDLQPFFGQKVREQTTSKRARHNHGEILAALEQSVLVDGFKSFHCRWNELKPAETGLTTADRGRYLEDVRSQDPGDTTALDFSICRRFAIDRTFALRAIRLEPYTQAKLQRLIPLSSGTVKTGHNFGSRIAPSKDQYSEAIIGLKDCN